MDLRKAMISVQEEGGFFVGGADDRWEETMTVNL